MTYTEYTCTYIIVWPIIATNVAHSALLSSISQHAIHSANDQVTDGATCGQSMVTESMSALMQTLLQILQIAEGNAAKNARHVQIYLPKILRSSEC